MKKLIEHIDEALKINKNFKNAENELMRCIKNWIKNISKPVFSNKKNQYLNYTYWEWGGSASDALWKELSKLLNSHILNTTKTLPRTGAAICVYVKSVEVLLLWNEQDLLYFYDHSDDGSWWSRINLQHTEDLDSILQETLKTGTYMERFHTAHYVDFNPNIDELVNMLDSLK